ncbi:MAG TPA: hypothetical protein VMU01_13000 [Rhizomicrobium sp.]|nr:hypothetical protein [Rhizomicrobium sp.]
MKLSRRDTIIAAGGAAVVVAAGVGGRFLLRKRHGPTPYDDLLALLTDRDAAAQIGEAVLAEVEDFDPKTMADDLRTRIGKRPLPAVLAEDADRGRVVEAGGWVLPETLGLLFALAAKAET